MAVLDLELCRLSYKLTLEDYVIILFNKIFSGELNEDYLKPIIKDLKKSINGCYICYNVNCFETNYVDLKYVYGSLEERHLNYEDDNDYKKYVKLFKGSKRHSLLHRIKLIRHFLVTYQNYSELYNNNN